MKAIYKIARSELSMLFYSPIAWLILIVFTFQVSMSFCNRFEDMVEQQAINNNLWDVTERVYTVSWGGLFSVVQQYLYLYIPLLTMGIMSRERGDGSIKLLYSSPVTSRQIILGKYLALVTYALALMAILSLYILFGLAFVKDLDVSHLLSALLGLYLLTCAYAAIGLFMSCLTSYQVVAAIATLALLAMLNIVGRLGQDIPVVSDVTYWLSIQGRADELIGGLVCSEDLLYFLIVSTLFVCLAVLKLQDERRHSPWPARAGRYAGVVAVAVILGYLSASPRLMTFHDATFTQRRTLTPPSRTVMNAMDGGLTITTYVNLLEENYETGLPANVNKDKRRFREYLRFKPAMKMKYVYYYDHARYESLDLRYPGLSDDERAAELAAGLKLKLKKFLPPAKIREKIDLSEEQNRFVRLVERENGQKTFLRVYDDLSRQPSESEITAAMKRLTRPPVNIAFLAGHGERDIDKKGDRDYHLFTRDITFRQSMSNNGFESRAITLDGGRDIPGDVDILVIANLKAPLDTRELGAVHRYIAAGGNLIAAAEPGCQEYMNPVVAPLGVTYLPGRLVHRSEDHAPNLIFGMITPEATRLWSKFHWMARWNYRVTMPDAVGMALDTTAGFTMIPLVASDTVGSWNELETADPPLLDPAAGERLASYPVAVQASRQVGGGEQRVILLGDADCLANGELSTRRQGVNTDNMIFLDYAFSWLTRGEFPINTDRPRAPDSRVYVGLEGAPWVRAGFLGLLPALLLAACMTILTRRKNR